MGVLAGWAYRKAITVNHTDDGAQTNYQMKLTINHGDGADSTGLVYLNHHALNWPTDIQITASDGTTPVDFWREESDATDGTWWIECPSIPAGGTWTGYIYYGDLDAADESDVAATFIFGDDFRRADSATVGNGWTEDESGTSVAAISGNTCLCTSTSVANHPAISKNYDALITTAAHVRLQMKQADSGGTYAGTYCNDYSIPGSISFYGGKIKHYDGSWIDLQNFTNGQYYIIDSYFIASTSVKIYIDGTLRRTRVSATPANLSSVLYGYGGTVTTNSNLAFIVVANYTLNEPTWAASGAEEVLGGIIVVRNKLISVGREPIKRIKFHKNLKLK